MSRREPDRILLNLQDRTHTASSTADGAGEGGADDLHARLERSRVLRESRETFMDWQPALAEYRVDKDAVRDAMGDMTRSVREKAERNARDNGSGSGALKTLS